MLESLVIFVIALEFSSEMKTATALLCLVAIVISAVIGSPVNDGRIVNGMIITNKQAPYMVLIVHRNRKYCVGSLIAPDYVVTAGHCVYGRNMDGVTIIANITRLYESGIRRKVSRSEIHPEYNPTDRHSDVAVLQLNEPIPNASTLELCQEALKENDTIQVSGWGRLGTNKTGSPILQTVYLPVRSQKTCKSEYAHLNMQDMFCASGLKATSACKGDSGGPAVFKGQLCGIVAFAYNCGDDGRSGAYTDVYAVKSFIENFKWLVWS